MAAKPLPTYYVSHGGGPWPWMMGTWPGWEKLHEHLQAIPCDLPEPPRAILCVSAHWEEADFTVQTHPKPPMYYDYGGFPPHTYKIQYPAPGSPDVAKRVMELLAAAGLKARSDSKRGFDHGAFVPLHVMFPQAHVPLLQLSLRQSLDPAVHLTAGRALAPLRREGVLIVGSGSSFHNFFSGGALDKSSAEFDKWLSATMAAPPEQRSAALVEWEKAPAARQAHAREEHLIPLHVAVGAAEGEAAERVYHEVSGNSMGRVTMSSFRLGAC